MGRRPSVPRTQLLMMYGSLLRRLGSARSFYRRRGRRPRRQYDEESTLWTLRALWKQWEGPTPNLDYGGDDSWEAKPKRPFPEPDLKTMLKTMLDPAAPQGSTRQAPDILTNREKQLARQRKSRPHELALEMLGAWFDVDPDTIERYITRFRHMIPPNIRPALNL